MSGTDKLIKGIRDSSFFSMRDPNCISLLFFDSLSEHPAIRIKMLEIINKQHKDIFKFIVNTAIELTIAHLT
ncbi:hypothetical protein VCR6J2_230470 [Vibrio coralliirubri]|nr:hypothetical protein VCR6J2_230470 [Vibrio coralliirubri]CDT75188.1 hypothetical protein VCR8J2_190290 [Vibrio coralliirubri]